jgi:hypothetical protein
MEGLAEETSDRIPEGKVVQPCTTSAGMTLETSEQFLGFNLYHEGMHLSVIKLYKILLLGLPNAQK